MSEKGFKISKRLNDDILILELNGYLDAHTAPELESAIKDGIDEEKYKIIVNFKELNYISSAGLGVFMSFIEDIREKDGDIKLCSMNEKVFSVFDLLGFPMLFEIAKNEEELIIKFTTSE